MIYREKVTEKFNSVIEAIGSNSSEKDDKFDRLLTVIVESFPEPTEKDDIQKFADQADFFFGAKIDNLPKDPSDFPVEYSDFVFSLYLVWLVIRIHGLLPLPTSKAFVDFSYNFRNVLIARVK